jgi:TatD DNase family protein
MLIDTHAHLYTSEFDDDRKAMLERAKKDGIGRIYLPNIDEHTIDTTIFTAQEDPNLLHPMMGLHPCYVEENYREQLEPIERSLKDIDFAGIGETGLDYFRDRSLQDEQEDSLHIHCQWAKELNKPIILHSRGAIDETISFIGKEQNGDLSGIFHCFTGNLDQAKAIIDLGFYMGIGGIVTFKNAKLDQTLENIPLEHIVLETDAPYLAPHPHRGKRNESAFLKIIAEKVAEVYGTDVAEIERITTSNAKKVFGDHKSTSN